MQYGGRVDLIAENPTDTAIIVGLVFFVALFVVIPLVHYWANR